MDYKLQDLIDVPRFQGLPGSLSDAFTLVSGIEDELRRKTAFLETLVNFSPDGILLVDKQVRPGKTEITRWEVNKAT